MKRMIWAIVVMAAAMTAFTSATQAAGRSVDNPIRLHKGSPVDTALSGSNGAVVYGGRPNDTHRSVPAGSEGYAEFAVMQVEADAQARDIPVYRGRPMDNYHKVVR